MIIAHVSEGCVLSCCYPEAISASTHEPHLCQKWINAGEGKIFLKGNEGNETSCSKDLYHLFTFIYQILYLAEQGTSGTMEKKRKRTGSGHSTECASSQGVLG